MKLIIDIPEDVLKEMKTKEFISIESIDTAIECIKNGTLLDDVKAEMESLIDWHDCPIEIDNGNDSWYCQAVNQCLEIIDKYIGKAEREDKE